MLAPGSPHTGFMSGANILLISAIAPNSERSPLIAPARTAIAMIRNTVDKSRSWAVAIIVLNMLPTPILCPNHENPPINMNKNTNVSRLTAFTFFLPSIGDTFLSYRSIIFLCLLRAASYRIFDLHVLLIISSLYCLD